MSAHQYDEGHTVAGWTGCGIATVGTVVAGVGVCAVSALWIGAGLGIVAVSVLVTWALHLTGWGKPPGRRDREQWGCGYGTRRRGLGTTGVWGAAGGAWPWARARTGGRGARGRGPGVRPGR